MARKKTGTLTEVELEFMQVIWEQPDITSEHLRTELAENGRDLADGAVRRMLAILMEKGYLTRYREGKEFYYSSRVKKEQAVNSIFTDLKKRLFGGSEKIMLASLLDTFNITDNELDDIKRQLAERTGEEDQ